MPSRHLYLCIIIIIQLLTLERPWEPQSLGLLTLYVQLPVLNVHKCKYYGQRFVIEFHQAHTLIWACLVGEVLSISCDEVISMHDE